MSAPWIEGNNRLANAIGDSDLADDIISEGYISVIAKISEINGVVEYYRLNHLGQEIGPWLN